MEGKREAVEEYTIKVMETESERKGKAYVNYKAWHEAYTGLVDEQYLQEVTYESCLAKEVRETDTVLVAKCGEEVVGFAVFGVCRDEGESEVGEVYAIYVLAEHYGKGVGYELMNAAAKRLTKYPTIVVWVLEGNERAIQFYQRYGFLFDGRKMQIELGSTVNVLRMIWNRDN